MPLNVIASSTRQWNPGDEFILFGIQNLFNLAFPSFRTNWIIYDRNPDTLNSSHRIGNSWHHESLNFADLIVIAGSPQWTGGSLAKLYEAAHKADKKVLFIGIGSGVVFSNFTKQELYLLEKSPLIIARDSLTFDSLGTCGIIPRLLPCPALFATMETKKKIGKRNIGFGWQTGSTAMHGIGNLADRTMRVFRQIRDEQVYDTNMICHYIDEYIACIEEWPNLWYSFQARDYATIYKEFDLIITTRLHGAVLANSLGIPVLLVVANKNNKNRVTSGSAMFTGITVVEPEEIQQAIETTNPEQLHHQITSFKNKIQDTYIDLIRTALLKVSPKLISLL